MEGETADGKADGAEQPKYRVKGEEGENKEA